MAADPAPPPRFAPDVSLPPYTFVPGREPHPVSDPAGHSFGAASHRPAAPDPARPGASPDYLHGVDLFNHGYYWEAHEAWEGLWHACGRKGTTADFLKALIQLAAAGVKNLEEKPDGMKSHARRAAELWRDVARSLGAETDLFLGLRLPALIDLAEAVRRQGWPEIALLLPTV